MEIEFSEIFELNGALTSVIDQLSVKIARPFRIKANVIYDGKGVMLDTFDSVLQQADRSLIQYQKNIILFDEELNLIITQPVLEDWRFTRELTHGAVKQRLKDVSPPLRAYTAIADFNFCISQLMLLDDGNKTHSCVYAYTFNNRKKTKCVTVVQSQQGYESGHAMVVDNLATTDLATEIQRFKLYSFFNKNTDIYCSKPHFAITSDAHAIGAVNELIKTFIQIARKNEAGIIHDVDTEFLHDYRVSMRKVRSALSLFKGVYDRNDITEIRHVFSKIMKTTNHLRDFDVHLCDQDAYFSILPRPQHDGLKMFFDIIAHDRNIEQNHVAHFLMSHDYESSLAEIELKFKHSDRIREGPLAHDYAADVACSYIWKRYRKICEFSRSINSDTSKETVHKLRIQCKKLRYLMEFFKCLFPEDQIGPLIKSLKILQDNLGRFNDLTVQQISLQHRLREHSNNNHCEMKLVDSVSTLITVLDQQQSKERHEIIDHFSVLDSPEIRTCFKTLCKKRTA